MSESGACKFAMRWQFKFMKLSDWHSNGRPGSGGVQAVWRQWGWHEEAAGSGALLCAPTLAANSQELAAGELVKGHIAGHH